MKAGYEQPICNARIHRGGPEELLQLQHCTRIVYMRNTNDVSGHHNDPIHSILDFRFNLEFILLDYLHTEI